MTVINEEKFQIAKAFILQQPKNTGLEKKKNSPLGTYLDRHQIGMLSEKSVHAILKEYYSPDSSMQEIRVNGMVADIYTGEEIIEIQTKALSRLKAKLDRFLLLAPVTVVHPICRQKWLIWVDPDTGELMEPRKVSKKGSIYDAVKEMYPLREYLKTYLTNGALALRLTFLDMEEYRVLDGYGKDHKRRASKYDRIPLRIVEEVELRSLQDFLVYLPETLGEQFTSADLKKAAKLTSERSSMTLSFLHHLGVVRVAGKSGRYYVYERADDNNRGIDDYDNQIV